MIDYNSSFYTENWEEVKECLRRTKNISSKEFERPELIDPELIEQLIDLITSCYDDFVQNNFTYRIYENFSGYFKIFQQLNEAVKSKQNVAHHYDLKEDLYKLF